MAFGRTPEEEEEDALFLSAMRLSGTSGIPMVLKAAIELDVLEIINRAGPGAHLSATEIASQIPGVTNPEAPAALERILRFLASHSVLTCKERRYGLAPMSKFLIRNQYGESLGDLILMDQDPVFIKSWQQLKYAALDGVSPFTKAHGKESFEYHAIDSRFNEVFNKGMASSSTIFLRKILDVYKGFESITQLVDVGGGIGVTLSMIISKYPHIEGVNFDLPHVISEAPAIPGVEHVGGDMFVEIPRASNIFMKWILHDWNDEQCVEILKNCRKALSDGGKVIIAEAILPETPKTDEASQEAFYGDVCMLTYNGGGKERTENELKSLAVNAGFTKFEIVACAINMWVMELTK
uniref:O-methyltransferase 2 n=1 Tax=Gloriosa superba TaxID=41220 RepID=A0A7D5Q2P8_GLOSU|nr:O-methyltransferase 2 [Gloriosa superba]